MPDSNVSQNSLADRDSDLIAMILRVGLGSVFLIGGWWKLSRAIDPGASDGLVALYTGTGGYINAFFYQFLFEGPLGQFLVPLTFLKLLSGFELIAGAALIAGLFVRSLSFIFAFLLWTFVIALPVATASGVIVDGTTHMSPAILVQIRDVALSGLFFVLFALGSGANSIDHKILAGGAAPSATDWNKYGLLLRLCLAVVFLIGGVFAGYGHIKTFVPIPAALIAIGLVLASGHLTRFAAAAALAVLLWYCASKISFDTGFWNNLNSIKRELALIAGAFVLLRWGGGSAYRWSALASAPLETIVGRRLSGPMG
jgi:uncharacterized membrane protein YphA (DoxX/SURF4 family)